MDQTTAVLQAQKGDKDSFRFLVETYQRTALSTAFFLTHHHQTAEDAVQEAFVQCYLHLSELREPAQFKWWFYRILTRIAWRKKAKDGKTIPIADIFPAKEKELEAEPLSPDAEGDRETLEAYVNQLDEIHRTVLILYYFNDFSVKEIASILDCSEGTVKSRLYHGRQKLKEKLIKERERKTAPKEVSL